MPLFNTVIYCNHSTVKALRNHMKDIAFLTSICR
uniref:Uncharacterized protein n=1 Tax=Anguilla anguilla TaxID=7936 RepID=A0A0E9W6G6_ANGAN